MGLSVRVLHGSRSRLGHTVGVSNVEESQNLSGLRRILQSGSTPDRLRLQAFITVLVIVAVGATAWLLTNRLVDETTAVAESTGEVLIATQQVSSSLAEADAAAVSVHLAGANGNREQRRLFEQATGRATASLERVARLVGDDERSHDALQDIGVNITRYSGLIEAARLASIENLGQADALLTQASLLNRSEISPEVQAIADQANTRFDQQTSSGWYAIAIALLIFALVVVVLAQFVLARKFHRLLNIPLVLSTIVLLGLLIFATRGFTTQQRAFNNAETEAFDAIQVSEQIQQVAFRHRAASASAVLTGTEASELAELEDQLSGANGLLDRARVVSSSERERASARIVTGRWTSYVAINDQSQIALGDGDRDLAEAITQGDANSAFNGFNTSVEAALLDNREQFLGQLDDAATGLRGLQLSILIGSLLAAVLAWWGFAQRIGEYR